jgi:transposase
MERAELNHQLARQDLLRKQLKQLQAEILLRYEANPAARLISTMPGAAAYSSLGLASRIGDIRRFKHPRSLANYWGLTPGSRNSGEATRMGWMGHPSITQETRSIKKYRKSFWQKAFVERASR